MSQCDSTFRQQEKMLLSLRQHTLNIATQQTKHMYEKLRKVQLQPILSIDKEAFRRECLYTLSKNKCVSSDEMREIYSRILASMRELLKNTKIHTEESFKELMYYTIESNNLIGHFQQDTSKSLAQHNLDYYFNNSPISGCLSRNLPSQIEGFHKLILSFLRTNKIMYFVIYLGFRILELVLLNSSTNTK